MDSLNPDHYITSTAPQPLYQTCLFPKNCHFHRSDQRKLNLKEELSKILIIYRSLEERGKLRERLHRGRRAVEGYQEIKQDIKKLTK